MPMRKIELGYIASIYCENVYATLIIMDQNDRDCVLRLFQISEQVTKSSIF